MVEKVLQQGLEGLVLKDLLVRRYIIKYYETILLF